MPRVRSKKKQAQQKRRRKRWLFGVPIAFTLLFIGFVVLLHQPFMRVDAIEFAGNETIHEQDLVEATHRILDAKVLWIFPRDAVLLTPKQQIAELLITEFERVKEATVRRSGLRKLQIVVKEHRPEYLWCLDDEELCYYIDQSSYVFSKAPYFSDHVFLKFTGSHYDVPSDPLGTRIFDEEALARAFALKERFEEGGLVVSKVAAEEYGDYAFYIDVINDTRVGPEGRIIVNFDQSNDVLVENLQLAFQDEKLQAQLARNPEDFEYIDIRFKDKIVYRFSAPNKETNEGE